jgi:two-component system cell cycle response regulator DivK
MKPLRILVVDDNPDNVDVAQLIMEKLGHHVDCGFNGHEALSAIRKASGAYDLVLLDVAMPQMDGLTVLRELRGNGATRELPVICLSAKASGASEGACLAAGADAFLTKPYRRSQLVGVVDQVLQKKGVLPPGESAAG